MLIWLGGLAVAGSVILALTAARVGEHKSSTYGYAYFQFQESWGGEIGIVPPKFTLQRTYIESQFNEDAEQYEEVEKTESNLLVPRSISIDSNIDYGEQERDLLIFNAFEAYNEETYTIVNDTKYDGELLVNVTKPENANLLYDYTVSIPSQNGLVIRPDMGRSVVLLPSLAKGAEVTVIVTYSTKGMDVFKYNLSAYQNNVIQGLSGDFKLNTNDFEIYRFGLPHETSSSANGTEVKFTVDDFSTTQDMGVTFLAKQRYLDQIQSLMNYSPMSLALFLVVVFFFSQMFAVKIQCFSLSLPWDD